MNKEDNRPLVEGENKAINQRVYIGFIGYMSCGKPVFFYCGVKLSNDYKVSGPNHLPDMPCCVGCGGD